MSKSPKKRLCWNCEGNVSLVAETCPYCGVSVVPASLDGASNSFDPPYRFGSPQDNSIPNSPYSKQRDSESEETISKEVEESEASYNEASYSEFKLSLTAILFLLLGSVLFLFGLTLALFSHHGFLTLQWNASFWFIYSILSIPLLLFGWRAFLKLDQEK